MHNEIVDKILCSASDEAVSKSSPLSYYHYSQSLMIAINLEEQSITLVIDSCLSSIGRRMIPNDWKIHDTKFA